MYRLDVIGGQLVEEQVLQTAEKAGPRHMYRWVALGCACVGVLEWKMMATQHNNTCDEMV